MELKLYTVDFGHMGGFVAIAETREEAAKMIEAKWKATIDPKMLTELIIVQGEVVEFRGDF